MEAVLELPEVRRLVAEGPGTWRTDREESVAAMGKRLQDAYLDGAIPYLREHEPDLWAELEVLDEEDSPAALVAYERLFREGLLRYAAALAGKAA